MNKRPTLIFLNGPVGIGKSTLAQKYVDDHLLALLLSADDFVGSMGQWLEHEDKARDLALEYCLLIAKNHLGAGYDVIMPYLLADLRDIEMIEQVVSETGANLFECALVAPKDKTIAWALERGTWGEPGAPPLTEQDKPQLEELQDKFYSALQKRPKSIRISVERGDIEGTYQRIIEKLNVLLLA